MYHYSPKITWVLKHQAIQILRYLYTTYFLDLVKELGDSSLLESFCTHGAHDPDRFKSMGLNFRPQKSIAFSREARIYLVEENLDKSFNTRKQVKVNGSVLLNLAAIA